MTVFAVRAPRAARPVDEPSGAPGRSVVPAALVAGLCCCAAAGGVIVARPASGLELPVAVLVGGLVAVAAAALLYRRPHLAPWGAILLFAGSAELKLRVSPVIGVVKDGYVALLVLIALLWTAQRLSHLRRIRLLALPLAALGVLVALYLVNPAGTHATAWLYGTRLLVEVLALLLVGLLLAPQIALRHLVAAMTVVLPGEAALAWIQQAAGAETLVHGWGYQYGFQVRASSGGLLRTSGTFEDPFQLAALAVIGLALALFVASHRQAIVLVTSALPLLAATNVRTALIQAGVLGLLFAVRRGWWRTPAALAAAAAVVGLFVLGTTMSAVQPGAPEQSVLFSLNGRSTAWSQAVDGWQSLVAGNGVGARGIGSTITGATVMAPPSYDPGTPPPPAFAGSSAFLDSAYAQVQSDVGIVGTVALVGAAASLVVIAARSARRTGGGAAWAAAGLLGVSMIDWVGRSSLTSYTTGFLTLYVTGVLLGAGVLGHRVP